MDTDFIDGISEEFATAIYTEMKLSLFDDIEPKTAIWLLQQFTRKTYSLDETMMMEGEVGNELFILLSGEAAIKVGGDTVHKFKKGAIIGESGLAKKTVRRTATVLAGSSKIQVLVLTREKLDDIKIAMPLIYAEICRNIADMTIEKLGFANDTIQRKIEETTVAKRKTVEATRELEHRNWLSRLAATLGFSQGQ
ncbi:cyclic nucleotide-binding domain-containing protein [Candidatus Kuenenbacteria bacterium]|nr:cyclic nucleotide-binding domain-containing protein [Candidatus Kuenenbacteria bacterium]